jgi:hypothetical protein
LEEHIDHERDKGREFKVLLEELKTPNAHLENKGHEVIIL